MKRLLHHRFEDIICIENLLLAWQEFLVGKKQKKDVQEFQFNLMDNILALHHDLANGTYQHGGYYEFNINDPKLRIIHKATVRDRLLHHAVYRVLYPYFDERFIFDSYSCRLEKGAHRAEIRFKRFAWKVSENNTRTSWILKCDIKKFFHSIDQSILLKLLDDSISDKRIVNLLQNIVSSFRSGLPLGNLTSQLFCNIYMNEFDQFVKHELKIKYYIRYADDFVLFSEDKGYLQEIIPKLADFLEERSRLQLHPDKVFIKTLSSGVDFLGWVNFFDHSVLRTVTKKRMLTRVNTKNKSSYLGMLRHGNAYNIGVKVEFRVK